VCSHGVDIRDLSSATQQGAVCLGQKFGHRRCEMNEDESFSLNDIQIHDYLHLLGMTILYYDYFLTLSNEVTHIWSKPKLLSSWPFLLNRYFSLLADIAVNVGNFTPFKTIHACKAYVLYRQLMLVAAQIVVCYILTMRTYALYSQSRRVLTLMLCISGVLLGVSGWAIADQQAGISISQGCHAASSRVAAIRIAIAWECLFLFDCMIFSLTLYRSYKEVSRNRIGTLNDLFVLIARDGAIYFAVMASANLANTFTFYFLTPALRGALSTAASSISVSMMSRVMLNLQERAGNMRSTPLDSNASTTEDTTTFLFTSRINMSLQFNHSLSTAESAENHHDRARPLARKPLSDHGHDHNMHTIDEVIELREMDSSSRLPAPFPAPGLA